MTDESKAPERIWAGKYHGTWWQSLPHHQMTPYIREDVVQAMVGAALEKLADDLERRSHKTTAAMARSFATDDALAALEARDKRVRRDALREAAAMIGITVGHGGSIEDCQCGMCNARREDRVAILTLIEGDQTDG